MKLCAKFGEKILWDGRRSTFRPLMDLIIGHLRQVNGSYMINESFLHNYHSVGDDFLQSKAFKQEYGVNHAQAQYDKGYLYGILQSVTRNGGAGKKHVL